jgi:hypothetical protein
MLHQHLHLHMFTITHRGRTLQGVVAPQQPAVAAAAPPLHCWLARAAHCCSQVLAALQRCMAHTLGGDVHPTACHYSATPRAAPLGHGIMLRQP